MSQGGWSPPDPIPASYYAREAISPPNRLAQWASAVRRFRIPPLGGRYRLVAAVAAGMALLIAGMVGLWTRAAAPGATSQVPPPHQPRMGAPASTSSPPATEVPPTPISTPTPTRSPTPQSSVVLLNAPLEADHGKRVTLRVLTLPRTVCSITIGYPNAPRLEAATSGSDGRVSWTWQVSRAAPPGAWPVAVACGSGAAATEIMIS